MSGHLKPNTPEATSGIRRAEPATERVAAAVQESLRQLGASVQEELGRIVERAADVEYQIQKVIADSALLSRHAAARMLDCSVAKLDRLATAGEFKVTYIDSRPRFRLAELNDFVLAHTGKRESATRRLRRGKRSTKRSKA